MELNERNASPDGPCGAGIQGLWSSVAEAVPQDNKLRHTAMSRGGPSLPVQYSNSGVERPVVHHSGLFDRPRRHHTLEISEKERSHRPHMPLSFQRDNLSF